MIIDAFLANDEKLLVDLRLSYLANSVDLVFIGESTQTFSGKNKQLNFKTLHDGNRIFHIEVPLLPQGNQPSNRWTIEEFQRDYFLQEVSRLSGAKDIVLFCDVDEIPSTDQVIEIVGTLAKNPETIVNLVTPLHYRRLNWDVKSEQLWSKAKGFKVSVGVPGIRYLTGSVTTNQRGAHFSYLGFDAESIRRKYSSFSHAELDVAVASDPLLLAIADEFGTSHTGSFKSKDWGLLSPSGTDQLSEIQMFAYKINPHLFGSGEFMKHPKWKRMAASRRITLAIKKSDAKLLKAKVAFLEFLLVMHSSFVVLMVEKMKWAWALAGRLVLKGDRINRVKRTFRKATTRP